MLGRAPAPRCVPGGRARERALRADRLPALAAPFVAVVRGQQLALALAVARGLDPDRPHRLAEVTRAG